jgi:hypothetical protein
MPLTKGSRFTFGSRSCYFRHWPLSCQQKTNFLKCLSAYYFLKVHLHHISKIKSKKGDTKQYESRFFLLFLLDDRRIRIRIHTYDQCCGSMTFWGGSGSAWIHASNQWIGSGFGSGSGSFYFRHWLSRCQQKTNFLIQLFLLMTFSSYIYIIFQR